MRIIKPWLVYIFIALLSQTANSQNNILGKVIGEDGKALPYANALLLISINNELMKGAVTSENGDFILKNIPEGQYILQVSMVGFATAKSEPFIFEGIAPLQLPAMKLTETLALAEVEIKADKPLYVQKIDRMVINVATSPLSAGTTALEVLERSPGVLVNRQDNSISLTGKQGVEVMMNGKKIYMPASSLVQLLDGMSSDNIESIELITTPPANFDAEGNAGHINIVLKQNIETGLNGSYSLSAGVGNGTRTSENINFNYRNNKVNFYGSYGFSRQKQGQLFLQARNYTDSNGLITNLNTRSDRDPTERNHNVNLGLDYQASEKTILGVLFSAFDNKWSMDAVNTSEEFENGVPVSFVELLNYELHTLKNFRSNINLRHDFKKDGFINFDIDYLYYIDENPTNYINSYFDGNNNFLEEELTNSDKETPATIIVGNADYSNQINEKLKFETGVKATFFSFGNDVLVETFDGQNFIKVPTLTSNSNLDERILAAYTSFGYAISDKTDLKLGLRYEHTDSELISDTEGALVDRSYGELFPTAYLSHKVNDALSFGLSYSRRIRRPTLGEMAPFVIFLDPTTFFSGNPGVQPSTSNNVAFNTNYLSYLLKIEYSVENGTIANFTPVFDEDTNILSFQAINFDRTRVFSLTLGLPVTITNWWKMQNNFTYLNSQIEFNTDEISFNSKQNTFTADSNQSFTLAENLTSEISLNYRGPSQFGYGKRDAIFFMNIGFQKKFSEKWGTLKFNVNDLFDSRKLKVRTIIPEQNLETFGSYDFSNRTFILTYTRNFGNNKVKSSRDRKTGAEDEINRVN
jgi:outer membrane receptor protein involved in Fe transport